MARNQLVCLPRAYPARPRDAGTFTKLLKTMVVEVVSRKPVSGPDRRKQRNNREFRENRCLEPRPAVEFSGKASMLRPNSLAEDNRESDKSDQGRKQLFLSYFRDQTSEPPRGPRSGGRSVAGAQASGSVKRMEPTMPLSVARARRRQQAKCT